MPARRRSLLSAALPVVAAASALAALLGWTRSGGAGIEYPVEPPMAPEAFAAAICLHGPGSETVLAGAVVDAAGRPLAGVAVTAAGLPPALPEGPACEARGETGADGGFRLAVRRLPVTYELLAIRDGFAPAIATAPGDELAGGLGPLRITLGRGRDAAGRVTDDAGRPIAGAHVTVRRIRSIDGSPLAGARVEIGLSDGSSVVGKLPFFALSDARGGFVAHVPPGAYALAARRGDLAARLPLTVRAGAAPASWKPLAVRLAPPAGAVLSGRVAGLAQGEVAAVGVARLAHYPALTGEDGRYSIPGVPPGRHVVEVRIGGPAGWPLWAEVEVPAGAREATLDFTYPPRDRSLAVQILGYDHLAELDVSLTAAWPELSVGLAKNRAFDRTTIPDARGRIRFEGLPAGRYAVEVVHATTGRSLAQREVAVPEGELSLDLHRSTD